MERIGTENNEPDRHLAMSFRKHLQREWHQEVDAPGRGWKGRPWGQRTQKPGYFQCGKHSSYLKDILTLDIKCGNKFSPLIPPPHCASLFDLILDSYLLITTYAYCFCASAAALAASSLAFLFGSNELPST